MPITPPQITRVASLPGRVVEAMESTRRAMRRYRLAMAMASGLMVAIAIALSIAAADVSWVLPLRFRVLGLIGLIIGFFATIATSLFTKGRRFGRTETAAEIEAAFPSLGQRVRTSLEYSEPTPTTAPASASLVRAMVLDADQMADGLDFPAIVPWSRVRRWAFLLVLASLGIGASLASDPDLRIAARRLFLLPASYSGLTVEPGDVSVKEGVQFTVKATLTGRPVSSAAWLQRPVGSPDAWTTVPFKSISKPGQTNKPLIGTLESTRKECRDNFEYKVVADDLESQVYRVTVTHPLKLRTFEAAIEPPAYTRLKPSVATEGNFRVPEGSNVRFRIELDRSPRNAEIVWTAEGSKESVRLPLRIEKNQIAGELPPVWKEIRYELVASSGDGMELESVRFVIKVQADDKPTIKFLKPNESSSATPTTEIPMKVFAGDDYGVSTIGIMYRIGDGPEESLSIDHPADQPPSAESLAVLYLEKHPLTYSDSLSYRAFVEDNREPEPHRVSTELRYIEIEPYKRSYQFVDGGSGSSGTSVTLEELILRQRLALNRAMAHEDDRPVDAGVADRLSKDEAELAFATGDFARKLASQFGPINPLDEAVPLMEAATASLSSSELAAAIPQERAALTALTKARQNLKQLLTNSQSAGQVRTIDRQQREQKLRKPPAEQSKQAELARLEADIRKLAQEQRAFAKDVEPNPSVGSQGDQPDEGNPQTDLPSKKSETSSSPAERQRSSSREAGRLQSLAKSDRGLTDLARSRMDQAAAQVNQAEESIRADRPVDAADAARDAAERLDRLASQVAGLKAQELADRIARARDLAQAASKASRDLANRSKTPDRDQRIARQEVIAEDAKTLTDLIRRLESDAVEEDRDTARAIARASEANPPAEIEQALRQASAEGELMARNLDDASSQLDALARDLESARRDFTQPKLQQLLAAERKAAEVGRALESATDDAKKAQAEKALADLARAVTALKSGDGPIGQAADALSMAAQGGGTSGWTAPQKVGPSAGLYQPPESSRNAVRDVTKALQAKIQEMMLNNALVDRDGPVPPGYKEKVESYFRLLSEDLR